MIRKPEHGWCEFKLGTFKAQASYLTDVPFDLLKSFINHFSLKENTCVYFDREGAEFYFVITFDYCYIISEDDKSELFTINMLDKDLAHQLINDIKTYIDGWANWECYDPELKVEERKYNLLDLCEELEELMEIH